MFVKYFTPDIIVKIQTMDEVEDESKKNFTILNRRSPFRCFPYHVIGCRVVYSTNQKRRKKYMVEGDVSFFS